MESISLIPVELKRDIKSLYRFMCSDDQFLFSTNLRFNTEQTFSEWLQKRLQLDFHDFYMVINNDKVIGFVYNYDFSLIDGHCKLVVYVSNQYRKIGLGGIAAIMFIKRLFSDYPLRKVYSTIYEYNTQSLQSNLKAGFIDEGTINNYRYYDNKFYPIHFLSMSREVFYKTLGKLV